MTNTTTHAHARMAASVVIFSEQEAMRSGAGFWSNGQGWTNVENATLFTHEESQRFGLPLAALPGVTWLAGADAARASLAAQIKQALIEDGFDVALAPDGRWYSADEQDREEVRHGEYHTANQAWRDLAESRLHVLEEAGLDHAGAFPALASSTELAQQYKHATRDAATVLHQAARADGEYELRVSGLGAEAYFEWVDQIGDPVGDVFTMIDFDQVEATLSPTDREGTAQGTAP